MRRRILRLAILSESRELRARIQSWRTKVGAQLAVPNPAYDPKRERERPSQRVPAPVRAAANECTKAITDLQIGTILEIRTAAPWVLVYI